VNRVSFDGQASNYEQRAGLPDDICREVAAMLVQGLPPTALVVDVGAGTGTLGRHIAGVRYVGIDVSRPMLAQFGKRALLVQADADGTWPLADGSADVILFSRSAHLLKSERARAEARRVARRGCRVFIGRVRRPRESAPEQLKRTMQHMLRDRNLPGKNGERAAREFLELLQAHGAHPLADKRSSEWVEREAPIDSLQSWRGKDGLAGRVVSNEMKTEILAELERWATSELGDLSTPIEVPRHYQLEGVQVAE
jgi:SAM-dependent methyltransferase